VRFRPSIESLVLRVGSRHYQQVVVPFLIIPFLIIRSIFVVELDRCFASLQVAVDAGQLVKAGHSTDCLFLDRQYMHCGNESLARSRPSASFTEPVTKPSASRESIIPNPIEQTASPCSV